MNTESKVRILSTLTTRDSAGKHFTALFEENDLAALESEGLITINRPIHAATGLPYSEEYYSVEVSGEGIALVETYPEYCNNQ